MTAGGVLLVHKPSGMTSHDVVQVVRRKLSIRRIGHAGTLDPMAQGLLVLLIGEATTVQQACQGHEKTYEATLRLGTQTDTADAMGRVVRTAAVPPLDRLAIQRVLEAFQGSLVQQPPIYSAIKIKGRPSYWWARHDQPQSPASRVVHIASIELIECASETITFRVECSAGTYVRTLAESIAERLGTVGHLSRLIRLRVGAWSLEEAVALAHLLELSPEEITQRLIPTASMLV